jgi:hypothetical protein
MVVVSVITIVIVSEPELVISKREEPDGRVVSEVKWARIVGIVFGLVVSWLIMRTS